MPSEGPGCLWKLGIETIVGSLRGGQKKKKKSPPLFRVVRVDRSYYIAEKK